MVTGSILVWKGDMSKLQEPFYKSLERFDDQSQQNTDKALVQAWNTLQRDVRSQLFVWPSPFSNFLALFSSSRAVGWKTGMTGKAETSYFRLTYLLKT